MNGSSFTHMSLIGKLDPKGEIPPHFDEKDVIGKGEHFEGISANTKGIGLTRLNTEKITEDDDPLSGYIIVNNKSNYAQTGINPGEGVNIDLNSGVSSFMVTGTIGFMFALKNDDIVLCITEH